MLGGIEVGRRYLEFLSPAFSRFGSSRLVVALIWAIGFAFYLEILTRHPLMYGIDGPYYLVQVRSLLEAGRLEYGDPPLSFVLNAVGCSSCFTSYTIFTP